MATASYFKMVWPKCTSACCIYGVLRVFSPRKILTLRDRFWCNFQALNLISDSAILTKQNLNSCSYTYSV